MKKCPTCGTNYTDETLRFCLADGAVLSGGVDEQATFVRPTGDPMRVQIPQETSPQSHFQTYPQQETSSGSVLKIVLAIGALLALLLVVLGAAGVLFYYNSGGKSNVANVGTPSPNKPASPVPSPSPSPKDETSELKDQISNLERMINEQKNQNRPVTAPGTIPNPSNIGTTARVNSPADGFLALRSFPSSQTGTRIATIPHGASVSIGGCLNSTRIGNKTGRWCRANYNGYSGWVFDAWLIY